MATSVDEPIQVEAVFARGQVRPLWFEWRRHRYPVQLITLRWSTRCGRSTVLHFGVSDRKTLFELTFQPDTLVWRLASVDAEHF